MVNWALAGLPSIINTSENIPTSTGLSLRNRIVSSLLVEFGIVGVQELQSSPARCERHGFLRPLQRRRWTTTSKHRVHVQQGTCRGDSPGKAVIGSLRVIDDVAGDPVRIALELDGNGRFCNGVVVRSDANRLQIDSSRRVRYYVGLDNTSRIPTRGDAGSHVRDCVVRDSSEWNIVVVGERAAIVVDARTPAGHDIVAHIRGDEERCNARSAAGPINRVPFDRSREPAVVTNGTDKNARTVKIVDAAVLNRYGLGSVSRIFHPDPVAAAFIQLVARGDTVHRSSRSGIVENARYPLQRT